MYDLWRLCPPNQVHAYNYVNSHILVCFSMLIIFTVTSNLQLFEGLLLQVGWAKVWLGEWVIPCTPPEAPAEIEIVFGWHLSTAVNQSLPHPCFQFSITTLNELKQGIAFLTLISHSCTKEPVCMQWTPTCMHIIYIINCKLDSNTVFNNMHTSGCKVTHNTV